MQVYNIFSVIYTFNTHTVYEVILKTYWGGHPPPTVTPYILKGIYPLNF